MSVGGAESGHISVHPHPDSAHIVWAGNYIGQVDRSNLKTGESRNMILYPQMGDGVAPRDARYRFQWNSPILISRHDPNVVYHASQYVHRTTNGGMSWETISPDLTTNNPDQQGVPGGPLQHDHTGVEVYNTIFVLSESLHDPSELWVGSDDGRVHITRDGGLNWTEITPSNMPAEGTVNSIDLHPTRHGRALMAVYKYRDNDFRPYVFLTDNFGEDWRLLTNGQNGIPEDFPVRVVREDPDRDGLFYAGTEFGMFISFDEGGNWQEFQQNLPRTPITDLRVHEHDLVVATQGRSFWILDDVTPLHTMQDAFGEAALHVFQPRDASLARFRATGGDRAPDSPPSGVVFNYWIGEAVEGEIEIEVLDATGTVIRDFEGDLDERTTGRMDDGGAEEGLQEGSFTEEPEAEEPSDTQEAEPEIDDDPDEPEDPNLEEEDLDVEYGMNRFVWDMRYPGPDVEESAQFSLAYTGGLIAPPGTYTIRIEAGDESREVSARIVLDPRVTTVTEQDMIAQFDLSRSVRDRLTEVHGAIREIRSIREQARGILGILKEDENSEDLVEELNEVWEGLSKDLERAEKALIQTRNESGQDPINFPSMLDDQLAYLYSHVTTSYGRPTEGAYQRFDDLRGFTDPILASVSGPIRNQVAEFNGILRAAGIGPVVTTER